MNNTEWCCRITSLTINITKISIDKCPFLKEEVGRTFTMKLIYATCGFFFFFLQFLFSALCDIIKLHKDSEAFSKA